MTSGAVIPKSNHRAIENRLNRKHWKLDASTRHELIRNNENFSGKPNRRTGGNLELNGGFEETLGDLRFRGTVVRLCGHRVPVISFRFDYFPRVSLARSRRLGQSAPHVARHIIATRSLPDATWPGGCYRGVTP